MPDSGAAFSPIGFWRAWRERRGRRVVLGVGYAVAALLTFGSVYLSTRAPGPGPTGLASRTILAVVLANLVLILALAASVGWRVVHILRARSQDVHHPPADRGSQGQDQHQIGQHHRQDGPAGWPDRTWSGRAGGEID